VKKSIALAAKSKQFTFPMRASTKRLLLAAAAAAFALSPAVVDAATPGPSIFHEASPITTFTYYYGAEIWGTGHYVGTQDWRDDALANIYDRGLKVYLDGGVNISGAVGHDPTGYSFLLTLGGNVGVDGDLGPDNTASSGDEGAIRYGDLELYATGAPINIGVSKASVAGTSRFVAFYLKTSTGHTSVNFDTAEHSVVQMELGSAADAPFTAEFFNAILIESWGNINSDPTVVNNTSTVSLSNITLRTISHATTLTDSGVVHFDTNATANSSFYASPTVRIEAYGVSNHGVMVKGASAAETSGDPDFTFNNAGYISVNGQNSAALYIAWKSNSTWGTHHTTTNIYNSGSLLATGADAHGIQVGPATAGGPLVLTNTGSIVSTDSSAVYFGDTNIDIVEGVNALTINNSGLIRGATYAIYIGDDATLGHDWSSRSTQWGAIPHILTLNLLAGSEIYGDVRLQRDVYVNGNTGPGTNTSGRNGWSINRTLNVGNTKTFIFGDVVDFRGASGTSTTRTDATQFAVTINSPTDYGRLTTQSIEITDTTLNITAAALSALPSGGAIDLLKAQTIKGRFANFLNNQGTVTLGGQVFTYEYLDASGALVTGSNDAAIFRLRQGSVDASYNTNPPWVYWDADPTTGNGVQGGSGTWHARANAANNGTTYRNWFSQNDAILNPAAATNNNAWSGILAIFSGTDGPDKNTAIAADAFPTTTVTIGAGEVILANEIQFRSHNYVIAGGDATSAIAVADTAEWNALTLASRATADALSGVTRGQLLVRVASEINPQEADIRATFAVPVTDNGNPAAGGTATTLVKTGGGTLALAAQNTFTGATQIKEGALELTGAGTLGATGALTGNYAQNIVLGDASLNTPASLVIAQTTGTAQTLSGTITAAHADTAIILQSGTAGAPSHSTLTLGVAAGTAPQAGTISAVGNGTGAGNSSTLILPAGAAVVTLSATAGAVIKAEGTVEKLATAGTADAGNVTLADAGTRLQVGAADATVTTLHVAGNVTHGAGATLVLDATNRAAGTFDVVDLVAGGGTYTLDAGAKINVTLSAALWSVPTGFDLRVIAGNINIAAALNTILDAATLAQVPTGWTLTFSAARGGEPVGGYLRATYGTPPPVVASIVPEPSTYAAGGMALLAGLLLLRRRRRSFR
jgi:autotransporter-associated beta strand protein